MKKSDSASGRLLLLGGLLYLPAAILTFMYRQLPIPIGILQLTAGVCMSVGGWAMLRAQRKIDAAQEQTAETEEAVAEEAPAENEKSE